MERHALELHFRVGKVPVAVEPSFWLLALILGLGAAHGTAQILAWLAIVFVGVLLHELGHAFTARVFGSNASIRLYAFGGLTFPEQRLGRGASIAMALAGPGAGFLLGGMVLVLHSALEPQSPLAEFAVSQLVWVNIGWGVLNLVPVLPLDGGHVLLGVLGPKRQRAGILVSAIIAALIAVGALYRRFVLHYLDGPELWAAIVFGLLAMMNLRAFTAQPSRPEEEGMTAHEALARGWRALAAGEEELASKLAMLVLEAAADPEDRNKARDLLAWVALAGANRREALRHLERSEPPEAARALTWAMVLEALQDDARALPYAMQAVEKEPSETSAALAIRLLVRLHRFTDARRLAEDFAWPRPAAREAALADVAFGHGEFADAAARYGAAFKLTGHAGDAYNAACSHARADNREEALAWLGRALAAGFDDLEQVHTDPDLASIRSDPEFARLVNAGRPAT